VSATDGWPVAAIAKVKDFQPYTLGNSYKSHHLWKLNYLWNLDKHRNMALHSIQSDTIFIVAKGIPVEEWKFDDGTTVKIPLSAKDKVRFNPRPTIQVFFGDEERGIEMTIEDLGDMYDFVSREVVPALLGFIP
jgi:hypothetical protein